MCAPTGAGSGAGAIKNELPAVGMGGDTSGGRKMMQEHFQRTARQFLIKKKALGPQPHSGYFRPLFVRF
jgi:hypothetical protein